jgi:polysaccharide biosynthesis protein PelE
VSATPAEAAPRRRAEPVAGAAAFLALAAEGALATLVLERMAPVALVFAGHLAVVALLAGVAFAHRRVGGRSTPLLILLAITTAMFGPLGAAGSLLVFVLRLVFPADAEGFEAWYRALFPEDEVEEERRLASLLDRVAGQEGEVSIGPLFDILSHGTRAQKQIAIAVMTRGFNPVFAPALRMALRDADNAIRVQAATSMTTIENNFMKRAAALDKAARAAPDSPEALKAVAQFNDDYAATGLLDPLRERRSRRTALDTYLKYLKLVPGDGPARLAVARLLIRRKRYGVAAAVLERCRHDGLFTPNMASWYMECLFHLRRYPELRRFAHAYLGDVAQLDQFPIRVVEMVRLWAGEGLAEKAA